MPTAGWQCVLAVWLAARLAGGVQAVRPRVGGTSKGSVGLPACRPLLLLLVLLRRPSTPACSPTNLPAHTPRHAPLVCRFQDAPAARLYERAGFQQLKADNILVRLLGLDRRRLMIKQLRGQQY